jgi:hypothetical protein
LACSRLKAPRQSNHVDAEELKIAAGPVHALVVFNDWRTWLNRHRRSYNPIRHGVVCDLDVGDAPEDSLEAITDSGVVSH